MDDKIIKFKNRVEIKILLIVCFIIFIPLFILLISEIIKRGFNELWPFVFMFSIILLIFVFVLFVINRFCITFDYKKSEIMYTPYFRKTKVYKFNDVKIYYCKGKTTLPNDYVFNFINNNKVIFKISSIDFEFQTKEKVDLLKEFFDGNQKYFYELEKTLKIPNGKLFIITYELDEETQLYWVSSRYYSLESCRWISPDSIKYLDPESINGLNLYAYCGNDPVNRYDPSGHAWDWAQFGRGLIVLGIAAAVVAAVAVITVASGGTAAPVLIGAGVGALVSGGVSAGCQLVSTGEINVGQLLTDIAVGSVSGAFGGSALGTLGMSIAGTSTGFLGSVAGDLVKTGSFDSINWGAAAFSGFLGLVTAGIGAQNGKLGGVQKFTSRLNTCYSKGITGGYYKNTMKYLAREKMKLITAANNAIYKSIPGTIGTSILDYYL